jgi:transcriptional regulator with XRE-family HTH domain
MSLHFRQLRRYPTAPKTLGEHLRKKREDMQLSMTQLAKTLGLGIADAAIEKWEKNQDRPTDEHRKCIVEFLGFNPARTNPTGGFLRAIHREFALPGAHSGHRTTPPVMPVFWAATSNPPHAKSLRNARK